MARHGSLADQLEALQSAPPKAANDNQPQRKLKQPRYQGTLPALRWLWDNHPELAPAFANALPRSAANWFVEVEPTRQEIRPTVGELMAASHDDEGQPLHMVVGSDDGNSIATIGRLKFRNGALTEWGVTKKGKRLKPTDRPRSTADKSSGMRNPARYLATKVTMQSPMHAEHYHRPLRTDIALPPMYDPLPGVEAARETLKRFGVDGSVPARDLMPDITVGPLVVAEGAGFLGGVSSPSGNSSDGALMWEMPEPKRSDAVTVIEEVAARGTLKSIGISLGYSEDYADRAGKAALLEVAKILSAANDNKKSE